MPTVLSLEESFIYDRVHQAGEAAFWATADDRWWEAWQARDRAEAAQLRKEAARLEAQNVPSIEAQRMVEGEWQAMLSKVVLANWREEAHQLIARLNAEAATRERRADHLGN